MNRSSPIPGVSVLIACNDDTFLLETLKSVREQDFPREKIELVLVESCYTVRKDHQDYIREHFVKHQIIRCSIPGVVAARNMGLSVATFDLVAILDADDRMKANRIALQVERFRGCPDLVALGGQIQFIDEMGEPFEGGHYHLTDFIIRLNIVTANPLAHPATMFLKSAVMAIGGYREGVPEDWDLCLRLSELGLIQNLSNCVIDYRRSANQLSRTPLYTSMSPREKMFKSAWIERFGENHEFTEHSILASGHETGASEGLRLTDIRLELIALSGSPSSDFARRHPIRQALMRVLSRISIIRQRDLSLKQVTRIERMYIAVGEAVDRFARFCRDPLNSDPRINGTKGVF